MRLASLVVALVAIASGTAHAQPGNTPPTGQQELPPPPPQGPPPQGPPPPGTPIDPNQVPPGDPNAGAPMPPTQPPEPNTVKIGAGLAVNTDELVSRIGSAMPTIGAVAKGAFRRARRAISIGPTVGLWAGRVTAQDYTETAISFGLGLEVFKVPVWPSPETLRDLVMQRAKEKVKETIAKRFEGQNPDLQTVESFARQVWQDAVNEVLGLRNLNPQTVEKPRFNIALEVNRTFEADFWIPRLRVGIGIWKLTLGTSFGVALGGNSTLRTPIYTGIEVVAHLMVSDQPRSSVFDVFLRTDFELRNRDTNQDMITLGIRYLLDII